MGKLTTVLLMTCLILGASKCNLATRRIVCAQINSSEIRPLPLCDISFQFDRCRCRCFNFNEWETLDLKECKEFEGMEGQVVSRPVEFCEGVAGFFIEDIASDIKPNVKKLGAIKDDYCDE
jgi:hypothetical protein